ncbi:MAG: hypothetical protein AABX83_02435 [Nanoarchaeota archaeon]
MKKEFKYRLYILLIFLLIISFFGFTFPKHFLKYFIAPVLSPFFPDFSPFNVSLSLDTNKAPLIIDIANQYFVCEGNRTDEYFNVTDLDKDPLVVGIAPSNPFFVSPISTAGGVNITPINLFSGLLDKSRVNRNLGYGLYQEIISVSDAQYTDIRQINITVIEKNNAPGMGNIGVRTVWTKGDDSTFYHQVLTADIEDGTQNFGNLSFSLVFLDNSPKLFNISTNGTMLFTPNATEIQNGVYNLSVYNLSLCVEDKGLINVHPLINNFCGQDGTSITSCQTFSLTITDQNRPPQIINYFPLSFNFNALGTDNLYFNMTVRDPDGTVPDAYWYLDNSFIEYDNNSLFDEFRYNFGCGVSGLHNIRADVTDGLLNGSIQWNVSVGFIPCPSSSSSGGGGGGSTCSEKWGCLDWNICQDADSSFKTGLLSNDDFKEVKENCQLNSISSNCGFQLRDCIDVNKCKTTNKRPDLVEHCFFITNPSCFDNLKNCHSGDCELLVDCGGPCDACSTCSDGTKNQGEFGIDCGGPCPLSECPKSLPIWQRIRAQYVLGFLVLLILIVVVVQIIRMYRASKIISG